MQKKLATSIGKTIAINDMYVFKINDSSWLTGGNLELINDDSLGARTRIVCSVSPLTGDKFMETKKRREIAIIGKIETYSSSTGLIIKPCNATWQ
jgi:hypothetical protein